MLQLKPGGPRKLTEQQVAEIKALRNVETRLSLARRFGVSESGIDKIYQGRIWRHVEAQA